MSFGQRGGKVTILGHGEGMRVVLRTVLFRMESAISRGGQGHGEAEPGTADDSGGFGEKIRRANPAISPTDARTQAVGKT